ncbi:MAG TPA: DUF1190 domain-containing protein [Beijerinckiaceae bacterium]|jgi:uncharacterized protein YgiB involved in biofilm formation
MKRSTKIGLGAAGVVLAASAWSHFGGEGERLVYNDRAACLGDGKLQPAQCERHFDRATAAHLRNARRYPSRAACEGDHRPGDCQPLSSQGAPGSTAQAWIPALAGVMVARGLMGVLADAQPLLPPTRQACPPGAALPECQPSTSGGGGSGSGGRVYSTSSGDTLATSRASGPTRVSVASRGGFGSSGRGFSSSSS